MRFSRKSGLLFLFVRNSFLLAWVKRVKIRGEPVERTSSDRQAQGRAWQCRAHWFTSAQICFPACCNCSQLGAGDRRSAVDTLRNTSGRPRNRGSILGRIKTTVSFQKCSDTLWGPHSFITGVGALSAEIKRLTAHLDLVPRLGMTGAINLMHLTPLCRAQRQI